MRYTKLLNVAGVAPEEGLGGFAAGKHYVATDLSHCLSASQYICGASLRLIQTSACIQRCQFHTVC